MTTRYKIHGLICKDCAVRVQKAIEVLPAVKSVEIDVPRGIATVEGDAPADVVMAAAAAAGHQIELA